MLPDAVKAEQEPEPTPRPRRRPRTELPRYYLTAGAAVLVLIAAIGLCKLSGLDARLSPLPLPTQTPVPTATPLPTAVPTATVVPEPTETPVPVVAVGGQVVVTGTEDAKLKLRAGPGLNQETLLFVEDGTLLQVLEGPESGDGYIWWKVQVPDGQVGWVAGEWLEPVTP